MRSAARHAARAWSIASIVFWVALLAAAIAATTSVEALRTASVGPSPQPAASAPDAPALEHRRDEPQTTMRKIEPTVMCPSCDATLDQSNSPAADRMRAWIATAIAAGWTADEIRDGLVEEYDGDESILAEPRSGMLARIAWLAPATIVLVIVLAAIILPLRWRRGAQGRSMSSDASADASSTHSSSPAASGSDGSSGAASSSR